MSSILLCGVGGQGAVLASRVLAQAAMNLGYSARTAETIGMAQRGGCVVSHVRFGAGIASPLIPLGGADAIIASEPCEAVRNLSYLRPGGLVVAASEAIAPVTASLTGARFDGRAMAEYISRHARVCVVDVRALEAECGSLRPLNVALMGCAVSHCALGLSMDDIERALRQRVAPKYLDMNLRALALGQRS